MRPFLKKTKYRITPGSPAQNPRQHRGKGPGDLKRSDGPSDREASRPVSRAEDEAIVRVLLAALPEIERGAVACYYRGLQSAREIESLLQWAPGHLSEIRMELRKQFFATLVAMAARPAAGEGWAKERT